MAKHVLKLDFDYDFALIGISCHLKDYRLSWAINKILGIDLQKGDQDLEIYDKKNGKREYFAISEFFDEDEEAMYYLISNRCPDGYLVPEHREADFFLMIRDGSHTDAEQIADRIRSIDFVLTCFTVNIDRLKSKENLLF